MRRISFDVESHLIKPGMTAPRLVVLSWAEEEKTGLVRWQDATEWLRGMLLDDSVTLIGANVPYDFGVLCAEDSSLVSLVFDKYEKGLVEDVQTKQRLIDIANGELEFRHDELGNSVKTAHTLQALAKHWLGKFLKKEDTWRLRYAELQNITLESWPEDAKTYALDDAGTTLDVDNAQNSWIRTAFEEKDGSGDGVLPDLAPQMRAHFVLHLMSLWGIRTDIDTVTSLKASLIAEQQAAEEALRKSGIYREDGTKDTKRIKELVVNAWALRTGHNVKCLKQEKTELSLECVSGCTSDSFEIPEQTAGGAVKTDAETLKDSGDGDLINLALAAKGAKLLSTYIPVLESGTKVPITCRYNVLVASGRTSASSPNLQQPPRNGGVREAFIPRPGMLFCSVDYDAAELRALAQVCLDLFGYSRMADAINEGKDLHCAFGARLLKISYEDFVQRLNDGDKEAAFFRQSAKAANFGCPGGLGGEKLALYAKGMGIILGDTPAEAIVRAKELITEWKETFPEVNEYFEYISNIVGPVGSGTIFQLRSGRVRGHVGFCDGANTLFQGLIADAAKRALWLVSKEAYCGPGVLKGSRPVLFLHDEIIVEVPEDRAHEAAHRQTELMILGAREFIPDVKITAKPVLMRRWTKGASPVYIGGRLTPSRADRFVDAYGKEKTKWVPDL